MSVPYTRTLSYVLREQLHRPGALRLFVAPVASIPDAGTVTIDQDGTMVTIARLKSYIPAVGEGAVCIAAGTSIIAVGAIAAAATQASEAA
jgi:hypothetical protein